MVMGLLQLFLVFSILMLTFINANTTITLFALSLKLLLFNDLIEDIFYFIYSYLIISIL